MAFIRTMIFFGGIRPSGRTVLIQTLLGDVASQVPQATTDVFAPADAAGQVTVKAEAWPIEDLRYIVPITENIAPVDVASLSFETEAWPIEDLRYTLAETDAVDFLTAQAIFEASEANPLADVIAVLGQPQEAWGVSDHAAIVAATEGWAITDTASSP